MSSPVYIFLTLTQHRELGTNEWWLESSNPSLLRTCTIWLDNEYCASALSLEAGSCGGAMRRGEGSMIGVEALPSGMTNLVLANLI